MAIKKKIKKNIIDTARRTLGYMPGEKLSKKLQNQLYNQFKRAGSQGVLAVINAQRRKIGMDNLRPGPLYGEDYNVKKISESRTMPEKMAYRIAMKQQLPTFDEAQHRRDIRAELKPWWQTETEKGEWTGYTVPLEDIATERKDVARRKYEGLTSLGYQTADEIRNQNESFGARGIGSLSPAAQRLAERLRERQQFREKSFRDDIAAARRDLTTSAQRLKKQRRIYRKERAEGLRQQVGQEVATERQRALTPTY